MTTFNTELMPLPGGEMEEKMITVHDVIATEAFEDAKVVAGFDGLNNMISSITVAEVPDAADWLRGNELVCTTGFFIKDNTVSQIRWIERLIEHGAKALAIKIGRAHV